MKTIQAILLALLFSVSVQAQNPTTFFSEDFEGNTHKFTIVNGTQTNQWVVDTAAHNGGQKAAYISKDTGVTNSYNRDSASSVHLYTDVTFPDENLFYKLSFDWRCDGEGTYDNLRVFVVDTSVTPKAGYILDLMPLKTFVDKDTWQQDSFFIPASYRGKTMRLVFSWRNDNSFGSTLPAAIDNIVLATTDYAVGTTENLTWSLSMDGTLTLSGNGEMPNYSYPATQRPWASYANTIKEVLIGDGIETIGSYVFYNLTNLTSVTIPNSVTSIGYDAFYQCGKLTSVTIPANVTSIGNYAFESCTGLTSVTVEWDTPLSIASAVFSGLRTNVVRLNVPSGKESDYASADVWKNFYIEGHSSLTTSGTCGENLTWSYDMNGTLTITGTGDMEMFYYSSYVPWYDFRSVIRTLTLPSGLTSIGNYAFFSSTALASVTIPDSVTVIGQEAFYYCTGLTSVIMPDSLISIGRYAFNACSNLISITIPDKVTSIGDYAFSDCLSLTAFNVGNGNLVYASEDGVLFNKNKTTLYKYPTGKQGTAYTIPHNVDTIKDYAFAWCRLSKINNENPTPQSISSYVFDYVALDNCELIVPNGSLDKYGRAKVWRNFGNIIDAAGRTLSEYVDELLNDNANLKQDTADLNNEIERLKLLTPENLIADTIRLYNRVVALQGENNSLQNRVADLLRQLENCDNNSSNAQIIPQEQIKIYPNPVNYELRIVDYEWGTNDVVELYDVNGKRVYSARGNAIGTTDEFVIDMSSLQTGNYLLRIGTRIAKVVKQ